MAGRPPSRTCLCPPSMAAANIGVLSSQPSSNFLLQADLHLTRQSRQTKRGGEKGKVEGNRREESVDYLRPGRGRQEAADRRGTLSVLYRTGVTPDQCT